MGRKKCGDVNREKNKLISCGLFQDGPIFRRARKWTRPNLFIVGLSLAPGWNDWEEGGPGNNFIEKDHGIEHRGKRGKPREISKFGSGQGI